MKLMQERLEIETCLSGAAVGEPGDKNRKGLSLLILDCSVLVRIAIHAAKRFGKVNTATLGKLVEYSLRFLVQSADNTNIKRLGVFFHSSSFCTNMCLT